MNSEVQNLPLKKKPFNVIIISLAVFSLLMLALAGQLTYTVLNYDMLYNGIYINNLHVGKLSVNEVNTLLEDKFQSDLESVEITIKAEDTTRVFNLKDLNASYNYDEAVENAYSIGRSGNIFERLYNIFTAGRKGENVDISVSYNREKLEGIVEELYKDISVNVKEADLVIENEKVAIVSGHSGKNFDRTKVIAQIESLIREEKSDTIKIPVIITPPSKIDIEEFYKQIIKQPQDASLKIEENTVKLISHKKGRSINKSELIAIANELERTENTEKMLPVEFVEPEITTQKLNKMLFRDTLGTMSTWFDTSNPTNKNRGENIRISASKIDGKILAPGEIFSFNEVVGPRTAEAGYKEAHVYVAGEVVDGIGGGICQVSTTLYNAVLFADLEVVERRNHMFTVGYVPFGRDATVSYGEVDFKFKNSTKWPIKIETTISKSNNIQFTLRGTSDNPSRQVELVSKQVKTLDYPTKYIDDPTIPEGETRVEQSGKNGFVVETYKIIKENDKVIEQFKLHTSTYKPLAKKILRGTKKVEPEPMPEEPDSQQQEPGEDLNVPEEENQG